MLRIRMQSGRDLGKHQKTKASWILNEELPNISITQSQLDHPHSIMQMWLSLLEDFCLVAKLIQEVDTSIMVAQNMVWGISLSSAPSPRPRTKIPSYESKDAQIAPPIYTYTWHVNIESLKVILYGIWCFRGFRYTPFSYQPRGHLLTSQPNNIRLLPVSKLEEDLVLRSSCSCHVIYLYLLR
jgi:hypothetical protein